MLEGAQEHLEKLIAMLHGLTVLFAQQVRHGEDGVALHGHQRIAQLLPRRLELAPARLPVPLFVREPARLNSETQLVCPVPYPLERVFLGEPLQRPEQGLEQRPDVRFLPIEERLDQ